MTFGVTYYKNLLIMIIAWILLVSGDGCDSSRVMHLSMLSPIPKYRQGGDDLMLTNTCNISWNPLISNSPPLRHGNASGNGPPLGYILPASFLWYSTPPIPYLEVGITLIR